ncbi:MAG TPA: thiol-activated cytolysin family protein, partial [candidate division Zixibacteria bacterium]|nr:thiol-activated cytolysin family protein [candidate division Zixibacteria bacterium]
MKNKDLLPTLNGARYLCASLAALVVASQFLFACAKKAPTEPDNSGSQSFDLVISQAGEFETVTERADTLSVDTSIQDVVGDEDFFCTTRRVSVTEAPDEFPLFDPNKDIIWAGNLLQGATLDQATPSPIPVLRGPGTIVLALNNGADSVSRYISTVDLSHVFNAQNQIISENPGAIPARFSFTFEEVSSREQLALALDVSAQNLSAKVDASLSFSSDKSYNRYLVKLDQSFYTMAYQLPTSKEEIFDPSVTPEQLSQYVGDGNPAAFISSVTYGRKFYLLIESTSSREEMRTSLDVSFSAAVSSGSLGVDAKYVTELESVRIKAYALGGEAGDALSAVTSDFETLKTFLAQGARLDAGEPLSYVVRSLARPDKIVKVKVATEYDITDCVPIGESVENPIVWFRADEGVTKTGTANLVTRWANFFGKAEFDALPPTKAYGGRLIANAVPGPNKPAVHFQPGNSSASNEGMLAFSGVNFVQTDFTIWVVARMASEFSAYPEMLLFGSGATPGAGLTLGFRNSSQFMASNFTDTVTASLASNVAEFKLYTVRFSQTNGTEIFVNGELTPSASDP